MQLRPYQLEDVAFLSKLDCAGCFNEQRTGKTPTILNVLVKKLLRKVLIICPASAVLQWQQEYMRWVARPCVAIHGTPRQREKALAEWTYGAIISYGLFKEVTKKGKTYGMLHDILKLNPEAIILDEAHRIKNPKSAIAKALFKTIKVPCRYALTGTPSSNKQDEIYSILHWLYPDHFKSYWKFIDEYFETERKTNYGNGVQYIEVGTFKTNMQLKLQQYLSSMSTQRKRIDVMPWLPAKDYQQILLPPTPTQQVQLWELEQYFETGAVITQGILDRLIRYRQICTHPALLGLKGNSPKLDWIFDYLDDYPDRPTIIFSKFTSFIHILDELTIKKGVIIGETPVKRRQQLISLFQSGKINLLIINIDAGKEAITLDRAEAIIFVDKYPPVSDIQQAEDRFISTTEANASKPHTIIELIMKGTYDEQLYNLVRANTKETDVLNDYNKYLRGRRK